jgi:transcriptional regulator
MALFLADAAKVLKMRVKNSHIETISDELDNLVYNVSLFETDIRNKELW